MRAVNILTFILVVAMSAVVIVPLALAYEAPKETEIILTVDQTLEYCESQDMVFDWELKDCEPTMKDIK